MSSHVTVATPDEFKKAIDNLPTLEQNDGRIPSIFLAHGRASLSATCIAEPLEDS